METRHLGNILQVALTSALLVLVVSGDFVSECPAGCQCKWQSGNKAADCAQLKLHDVPRHLHPDIQNLDLSGNPLHEITQRAFEDVGLRNLKKLVLTECSLLSIHRQAFNGLSIMIELDLSKNRIESLHPDTFRETDKIRWIILNNNLLQKLDDGLFRNLKFLQKVEISNNRLMRLGLKTFMNLPKLQILRLDGNNFTHMKVDVLSSLPLVSSLDLHNNPWRCDCHLQPFRDWTISHKLYTAPTACAEPPTLNGKLWSELDSSDFACKPTIIYPSPGTTVRPTDINITLPCRVSGNPLPEVNWVLNSQIVDSSFRNHGEEKYLVSQSNSDLTKWYNLTIFDSSSIDNGEYLCVAKNPGGVDERTVTLIMSRFGNGMVEKGSDNNMMAILIGLTIAAAALLVLVIVLCYCFCRRRSPEKKKESNGEALIEGSVIPEMEKSLMSAVNPVTKPPRRYDAPPSLTSGATEMSEINKTLLDNDSVFAANEEESRSLDLDHQRKRSQDTLSVEYARAYPPDLLAFPPRAQISPNSNASTLPDTGKLHAQMPMSPLHSPIYGGNPNLFRTLPYSRSQSPFTSPVGHSVVTPRQGYVTIPRRPRVPSWSSNTSQTTQLLPSSEAQEPIYDNLGLRTTADGSSVLSLNKSGVEQFSPMKGRPLPATPGVFSNGHQLIYAPIAEHEPVLVSLPQYATNPRSSVSSHHQLNQFATPQEPSRMSWSARSSTPQVESRKALFVDHRTQDLEKCIGLERICQETQELNRKGPETGSLRKNPPREEVKSPQKEESKAEVNHSIANGGTVLRTAKIPPRPPPKPKKRISTDNSEPLFEDEGEDGTEV